MIAAYYKRLRLRYINYTAWMNFQAAYIGAEDQVGVGLLEIYSLPRSRKFRDVDAVDFMISCVNSYVAKVHAYEAQNTNLNFEEAYSGDKYPNVDVTCQDESGECDCEKFEVPLIVDGVVELNKKGERLKESDGLIFNTTPLSKYKNLGLCKTEKLPFCKIMQNAIEAMSGRRLEIKRVVRERGTALHSGNSNYALLKRLQEKTVKWVYHTYRVRITANYVQTCVTRDSNIARQVRDESVAYEAEKPKLVPNIALVEIVEAGRDKVSDGQRGYLAVGDRVEADIGQENNLIVRGFAKIASPPS